MRPNRILEKIRQGKKAVGAVINFPSEDIVELCGIAGLDFIHFDGQHGAFSPETVERLCRVADIYGITPTMRVPNNERSTILSYLDRGIRGIMAPEVHTRQIAEAVVSYAKFGPEGSRSFGSGRGNDFGLAPDRRAFMEEANRNILIIAQIESIEAVNNIEEIVQVPGIDLFAWGPNDLAQSMGYPGQPDHPEVLRAQERALQAIHRAGKKLNSEVMEAVNITALILQSARELASKHA